MTNAECISQLSNSELDYQISEVCRELRKLDRLSPSYDAATNDLREMFAERKARKVADDEHEFATYHVDFDL